MFTWGPLDLFYLFYYEAHTSITKERVDLLLKDLLVKNNKMSYPTFVFNMHVGSCTGICGEFYACICDDRCLEVGDCCGDYESVCL